MRKVILSGVIAFLLCPAFSYAFSSKGQDCSKCHTLKKEEAVALVKGVIPNPRILDIRITPLKAVWELDIEADGKKGIVYLDFSKKYLISGSVIDIKSKKNLTQDRFSEINKVNVSQIPLKDALVMGDKNAGRKVIVFDDPD